jgi:zinc protease
VPHAAGSNDEVKIAVAHERYHLSNGLEVVLAPDHRVPLVAIRMRYHSGAKDDPQGRAGLAHLVEHMTFACGTHLGPDAIIPKWHDLGGREANGETNNDHTDYYVTLPSTQLEPGLWIEAERMAFVALALDDATLRREEGVVHAEWREHHGNEPYGLVDDAVHGALFPVGHPYHQTTIGDPAEFGAATKDDIATFLRAHYVPENATLFIAGDFDGAEARKLVERQFSAIAPGTQRPAPRTVTTPKQPVRTRVRMEAAVPYPLMVVAWLGPPSGASGWYELEHGLGFVAGTLHRRVVEERKVAREVHHYRGTGKLGSVFELRVMGDHGATFDDLISEVKFSLWWNDYGHVGDNSLEIARTVFDLESLSQRTSRMANGLDWYGTPDFATPTIEAARSVTVGGVAAAIGELLDAERAVFVWVEPNSAAPPEGRVIQ